MSGFGSWLAREYPRVLASLGPAIAVVGLVVYAMGTAYREPRDNDIRIGVIVMVGGLVIFAAGLLALRAGLGGETEPAEDPSSPAATGRIERERR